MLRQGGFLDCFPAINQPGEQQEVHMFAIAKILTTGNVIRAIGGAALTTLAIFSPKIYKNLGSCKVRGFLDITALLWEFLLVLS